MDIQSLFGVFHHATLGTRVAEGVREVLGLYVVPDIHNGLVCELEADPTCWNAASVSGHKLGEFLWT